MRIESDQIKTLSVLAVLAVAFVIGMWMPLRAHRKKVDARLDAATSNLDERRHNTRGLAELALNVDRLEATVNAAQRYVPARNEWADLHRQFSDQLELHHVVHPEIEQGQTRLGEDYNLIPVTLRFDGRFPDFHGFLKRIETMPRLIRVTRLKLDADVSDADAQPLSVLLELSTFFAPTGEDRT